MGRTQCKVTEATIDPAALVRPVSVGGHGATNLFLGTVRERNSGKKVIAVSYDAFTPLAERVLIDISGEARAQWGPELDIFIVHRVGLLMVGEVSIAIAVGAAHRDESYQASRYILEQVKLRAPIWKQEHYDDGRSEWLKGHALRRQHSPGRHAG